MPRIGFGLLRYRDDHGEILEESVPVGYNEYDTIYDSLAAAITNSEEKCIQDDEVITVLEILEQATAVAKSWQIGKQG